MYEGALSPYVPFDPIWLEYTFVGLVIILPEKPIFTLSPKELEAILNHKIKR